VLVFGVESTALAGQAEIPTVAAVSVSDRTATLNDSSGDEPVSAVPEALATTPARDTPPAPGQGTDIAGLNTVGPSTASTPAIPDNQTTGGAPSGRVAGTTRVPAAPSDSATSASPPVRAAASAAPSFDVAPVAARVSSRSVAAANPGSLPAGLSDGVLLQRFVINREQAAFGALVQRYGGMVLGVCQKVLGDFHAAQDASQATFMVLARKAGMLDRTTPLGGWLYKVAYHLALRSRAVAARQRLGEKLAADEQPTATIDPGPASVDQREIHQVLREELQRLPEKYRAPLTLCYVDGRSHADAAQEIGLPRGSMAKRVGEGLERLRERLLHRGFAL
jgi:RNA polymerase sigma factor (sigma-70 family)